jgi:hypothetical protein
VRKSLQGLQSFTYLGSKVNLFDELFITILATARIRNSDLVAVAIRVRQAAAVLAVARRHVAGLELRVRIHATRALVEVPVAARIRAGK